MFNVVMQVTPAAKTEADTSAVQPQTAGVPEDLGLEIKKPATELAPQLSLIPAGDTVKAVEPKNAETKNLVQETNTEEKKAGAAETPATGVSAIASEKLAEGAKASLTGETAPKPETVITNAAAEGVKQVATAIEAQPEIKTVSKIADTIINSMPVETQPVKKDSVLNVAAETIRIEMKLDVAPSLTTESTEKTADKTPQTRLVESQHKQQEEFREIAKGHAYASMCWSAFNGVQRKLASGNAMAAQQGDPMMMVRSLMTAYSEANWAIKSVQNAYNGDEMPSFVSDALASIRSMRDNIGRKLTTATGMNVLDPELRSEFQNGEGQLQGGKFVQAGGFSGSFASAKTGAVAGAGETAGQGTTTAQ